MADPPEPSFEPSSMSDGRTTKARHPFARASAARRSRRAYAPTHNKSMRTNAAAPAAMPPSCARDSGARLGESAHEKGADALAGAGERSYPPKQAQAAAEAAPGCCVVEPDGHWAHDAPPWATYDPAGHTEHPKGDPWDATAPAGHATHPLVVPDVSSAAAARLSSVFDAPPAHTHAPLGGSNASTAAAHGASVTLSVAAATRVA